MAKKKLAEEMENKVIQEARYITTGCTLRDLVIGGNKNVFGYRVGSIYNIVSDSGAGKTFLAVQSIVANHFILGDKFKFVYDDCEGGLTFDVKYMYGMDKPLLTEDSPRSKTVEDLYSNIRKFCDDIHKDQVGLYVVDSLDGLVSQDTLDRGDARYKKYLEEKEFNEGTFALAKQKYLSQEFFPDIESRLKTSNIVLILISQTREKINASLFEKKLTRAGGKALQFYSHTVEWLYPVQKKEMEDDIGGRSGAPILLETEKNKTPRPFRKGIIILDYSIGVDDIATNVDYLYDLRTDKSYKLRPTKKDKLTWDDNELSRDELCDYIYDNTLEDELKKRVIAKWEAHEDDLLNRRKTRFV